MHLPVSLTGLAIACTLLMAPCLSAQTLHYNHDQLEKYVRLCQQLRYELYDIAGDLAQRYTHLAAVVYNTKVDLNTRRTDGLAISNQYMETFVNISSSMKLHYVPAANVYGVRFYTNSEDDIFTDVQLNHFLGYTTQAPQATVPMSGVYAVEYRVQMKMRFPWHTASTNLIIASPSGQQLHSINYVWSRECAPVQEMFAMEAGSMIKISNLLSDSSSHAAVHAHYYRSNRVASSQLSIRYISPLV